MLSNKKIKFQISKKWYAFLAFIVIGGIFAWSFFAVIAPGANERPDSSTPPAGASQVKSTGFRGDGVNTSDPVAVQAYCDDVLSAASQGEGAKIRDLCALNEVLREYLPKLSVEEIESYAENEPTCLQTGYDRNGYNCFNGYDRNGCSKSGINEEGQECRGSAPKQVDTMEALLGSSNKDVCDIVSGCQTEQAFGPDGLNKFGCNRQGRNEDGEFCPAEYITRLYGDDGRDQLGFNIKGFNDKGCDAQGFKNDGTECELDDVTLVYDRNNFDQFGLNQAGFNSKGCDLDGLDENGTVCSIEDIPRIFDKNSGLDQFGLGRDGFNAKGCDLNGYDRNGDLCSIDDIPRIFGSDGFDQLGLRKNGRNVNNCDINGLKPNGDICSFDEMPRLFSPITGTDQYGFFPNGFNENDCDVLGRKPNGTMCSQDEITRIISEKTGLDALGVSADGYALNGCNAQGFRRDGSRCALGDIPRVFDKTTGLDQFNLKKDGFNQNGCGLDGLRKDGSLCPFEDITSIFNPDTGYDQLGLNSDGLNENGCGLDGLDANGRVCERENITRIFDKNTGLDQFGLDADGFDPLTDCNLDGFDRNGARCDYKDIPKIIGDDGINQLGLNASGENEFGCDVNGRKEDGTLCSDSEMSTLYDESGVNMFHKDKDGFSRLKLNSLGFNENNCDINGLTPDGVLCASGEITRVYDATTGLDQFGLDKQGLNEWGCGLDGNDVNGKRCKEEHIPRIFDKDMNDQFGTPIEELPESVWVNEQGKVSDLTALLDKNGLPVLRNGKQVFVDKYGVLREVSGRAVRAKNGGLLRLDKSTGNIVDRDGVVDDNFTNLSGSKITGKVSAVGTLEPVLDENGDQAHHNGKPVFSDKDGVLRYSDGTPVLDSSGGLVKLSRDGVVRDSLGNEFIALTDRRGDDLRGKLAPSSGEGLAALLDESGNAAYHNGRQAFKDSDGVLRYRDGSTVVDENGNSLSIDGEGVIRDSSGRAVEPLENDLGQKIRGPLSDYDTSTQSALLNKSGERVHFNGKPVFVDGDGKLRYADGTLARDRNGKEIYVTEDGLIKNSDGDMVTGLTDKNGKLLADGISGFKQSQNGELLDKDGNSVYYEGKKVFSDADGTLRYEDGTPVLNKDGELLKLGANGEIRDAKGRVFTELTSKDGKLIADGLSGFKKSENRQLLDADGNQVYHDGKKVFTDATGALRYEDGSPVLNKDGESLKLGADGEIRDAKGRVFAELTDKDGKLIADGISGFKASDNSPLLDADGNQVYHDGKKVFTDATGALRYEDGTPVLNKDGESLKLGANGEIRDAKGRVFAELTDKDGKLIADEFSGFKKNEDLGLVDADGNQVYHDGKKVFASADGSLRYEDGTPVLNKEGALLKLGANGEIRDTKGNVFSDFTDGNGEPLTGGFSKSQDLGKRSLLLGPNGETAHYKGEPVYVNADGFLADKNGRVILDENGSPLRINSKGQIVNANGRVVPSSDFTDVLGEKMEGEMVVSQPLSQSEVEAKSLAEKLSKSERLALNIDADGYNSSGCGLNGLNRLGEMCNMADIPRSFDSVTGLDQLGFGRDNYNAFGCDIDGLDRKGSVCLDEYVTRIFDGDGFDQFGVNDAGLNRAGLNAKGENALGCDATGENCSASTTPKLTDSAAVDQFNKNPTGRDRLNLINGFNDKGCGVDGLDAKGDICSLSDIPLFLNAEGFNQFGVDESGRNRFGCDIEGLKVDGTRCTLNETPRIFNKTGFDQFGIDATGRNKFGCDLNGFKIDGSRCEDSETPKLYDKFGFDQFGIAYNGFNKKGCDINGKRENGTSCSVEDLTRIFNPSTGLDQFNLTKDGFNDIGCGLDGMSREGELCAAKDIPRVYGDDEIDQLGFGKDGFNAQGCDFYGYNRKGELCDAKDLTRVFDKKNTDQYGADKLSGRNENGCDLNGLLPNGQRCKPANKIIFKNAQGVDQHGLINGFNQNGCDINGIDKEGNRCDIEDVTRIIDPDTGRDQLGMDKNLTNKFGCDINGQDKDGKACDPKQITRWFDGSDKDQFGTNRQGFNDLECNLLGYKADGTKCASGDVPSFYGQDGFNQLGLNSQGFGRDNLDDEGFDKDGCDIDNLNRKREACSKYQGLGLSVADGAYIAAKKIRMLEWLAETNGVVSSKPIAVGSYVANDDPIFAVPAPVLVAQTPPVIFAGSDAQSKIDGLSPDINAAPETINIPAGYMTAIYVDTSVNSDYTDTVYAKITMGELEGATLIGRPVVPYVDDPVMPRDKFYYEFDRLVYNRQTISIDAVSINRYNDSGMVEADDVDYHRFQRYGGLITAAAIQALDASFLDSQAESDFRAQNDAIEQALGASPLIYGENTRDLTKQNLKTATQFATDLAKQQFNRRPTVSKGYGPQMIVFKTQVQDDRLPLVMIGLD